MPGGKIGVFSGVFSVATTDDQLAVVLAHEIAHVTAKHVHERLSQQMIVSSGGTGLGIMTGGLTGLAVTQAYAIGATVVGLGWDRSKETEADRIGLIYMARAGYNPRAAIELWEKMDDATMGKEAPPEWRSSHPSSENRLARLYGWMEEAEAEYVKARERDM
jgi:predicted Zn-dependent protease